MGGTPSSKHRVSLKSLDQSIEWHREENTIYRTDDGRRQKKNPGKPFAKWGWRLLVSKGLSRERRSFDAGGGTDDTCKGLKTMDLFFTKVGWGSSPRRRLDRKKQRGGGVKGNMR